MNGIEYALMEVDQELISLIPALKRRECTPRIMEPIDELLDTRNCILEVMAELTVRSENG